MMKYQVQLLTGRSGGGLIWEPYRLGQLFNSREAAAPLLNRVADRYGDERVRIEPIEVPGG